MRILRRASARWASLSSLARQRILLGALVAGGLAARDLLLLGFASSLFALAELMPRAARPARPRPSA
ncbi:MAG TPA: hypothetical protein VM889_02750 [Candidatus Thermoplasmatota archaeon]|nr:hypothetical protein [Candidatus Thermoplasmatota archaeon]